MSEPGQRRLAILGGYGGANIGDEMLLHAAARQARARGYAPEIVALGPDPLSSPALGTEYADEGFAYVPWKRPLAALRAVAGRDLLIGGGQLIDGAGGAKGVAVKLALALAARATGGRVLIGGVSTARLDKPAVRRTFRQLFRVAERIVTRDEASLADILAIAPEAAPKSEALADLVFGMREAFAGGPPVEARAVIAFAVHRAPGFSLSDTREARAFLTRLAGRLAPGQRIAVLAHDGREDWDLGLARALAADLGPERAEARAFATVAECTGFYREVRSVIAARMHPIILGACAGAFCVPLQSSRKVADMGARLGVPVPALAQLTALDDAGFDRAIGLGPDGPRPDPAAVAAMERDALRVIPDALPATD